MNIDFHLFVDNFVSAIEAKDAYTAGHSDRVADMSMILAERLGVSDREQFAVHMAAHLHDIGKIGIADGILLKTGKLTEAEFEVMKGHSAIGYKILKNNPELKDIAKMILHHHERYDGRGYPQGLSGDAIPLGARIIAVCDAFDAMVTKRTYKEQMTIEEAYDEIIREKGKQFDPRIADEFIAILNNQFLNRRIASIIKAQ